MNKEILLSNDEKIEEYNTFNIITNKKYKEEKIKKDSIFSGFKECRKISIYESGTYEIDNANRFLEIEIEENLNVEIIEIDKKTDFKLYNETNIKVCKNSTLKMLTLDKFDGASNKKNIDVLENAHAEIHVVGFNKGVNENKIIINLNEEGASSNLKIITIANENTHTIYENRINNNAPKTKADIWQKAVVKNGGMNDFVTTGFIKKGSDDASNYQESRVLLLDDASLGNASPLLLIHHYNVVAGHAAGVSRVNEDDLYYLQTRGISKDEAEKLMTLAFVKPLIDLIEDEEIKEEVLAEFNKIV